MLDSAALIQNHYERHALAWDADRRRGGWTDSAWLKRFELALPQGAGVLDLGCGGGDPVARYLTGCGHRVVGVDSAPTLLRLCRERLPGQEWILADMRGLALGRRFDGVLAWDSFFHLVPDDQRAMFPVFAAHVVQGGVLLFNAGPEAGVAVGCYRATSCITRAWRPRSMGRCWRSSGSRFCTMSRATRRAAEGRRGWRGP